MFTKRGVKESDLLADWTNDGRKAMEDARMVNRDYRNQVGPAISCSRLRESVLPTR